MDETIREERERDGEVQESSSESIWRRNKGSYVELVDKVQRNVSE